MFWVPIRPENQIFIFLANLIRTPLPQNFLLTAVSAVNIKTLAIVDTEAPQNAALPSPCIKMDLAIIGYASTFCTLAKITFDLRLKAQIDRGSMTEKDTFTVLWKNVRFLKNAVIDQLFGSGIVKRKNASVFIARHSRMNAYIIFRFIIIRKHFKTIYRFPIE